MSDDNLHPVSSAWADRAWADDAKYRAMYKASIDDPEAFWGAQGKQLDWMTPYTRVKNTSFNKDNLAIKWFEDGFLNVSANCIDRHLDKRGDQTAIIWEGDDPKDDAHITYRQLHTHVCKFANVLKKLGVKKGDRVTLYMPMIPEAAYAMLACTRVGAVHSIVFGGFSPDALAGRIEDCRSNFVITADEGVRGGKPIPLKANTDKAIEIAARRGGRPCRGGQAHGRQNRLDAGPRCVAARGSGNRIGGLPARADERRRPAFYPLHLGLHRQTQGGAAHHRRLSALCRHDPQIRLRLP